MKISLAKQSKRAIQKRCHEGRGSILFRELFKKKDFKSKIRFLHETIVSPNSSIGYHKHIGNEEIYYVISGTGVMNVDGEKSVVVHGDAVITYSGSSHGLENESNKNLKILVFEAVY